MRRSLALGAIIATVATSAIVLFAGPAAADPSADDWYQLRMCESSNRYDINTGNGYYGAYQFDLSTWRSVGGSGRPDQATASEQDYRALLLYRQRGWEPWVCAYLVGLTEDGDAGSGVAAPEPGNQSSGSGASEGSTDSGSSDSDAGSSSTGSTAYPGRQFYEGDYSEDLKAWQKQMGTRGYDLVGTGYFGPKTKAAVLDLQAKAGLNVVGFIGPKTWAAAWDTSSGAADTTGSTETTGASSGASSGASYTPQTNESCGVGQATAPEWSGKTFNQGDTSRELQCFQKQLGSRGYALTGTGYYGPATKTAVVELQTRNGINPSGILGPLTWKAAWEGQ